LNICIREFLAEARLLAFDAILGDRRGICSLRGENRGVRASGVAGSSSTISVPKKMRLHKFR